MPEISEGDKVVTPEGEIHRVSYLSPEGTKIELDDGATSFYPASRGIEKLVKVDQPIRVKVSRQCYAESLVALAEECGFETLPEDIEKADIPLNMTFHPLGHEMRPKQEYDLTYAEDLPQIEAWLEYHSESEYECDRCGGKGHIWSPPSKREAAFYDDFRKPCPNCTDESDNTMSVGDDDERWIQNDTDESEDEKNFNPCDGRPLKSTDSEEYDEPRPEDEGWDRPRVDSIEEVTGWKELARTMPGDQTGVNGLAKRVEHLMKQNCQLRKDYNDLESELQDVRKERDELDNKAQKYYERSLRHMETIRELRKTIEEAIRKFQETKD